MHANFHNTFQTPFRAIAPLLVPAMLLVAVFVQPWIAPADLLRDPIAVAELKNGDCCSFYYGAVSNLGVLIWAVAAAVSLFSGLIVASRSGWKSPSATVLIGGGLLTAVLTVDDLFLIHENALGYFSIPQPLIFGAYGAVGLMYLAAVWRQLLFLKPLLFVVAVVLLGTSVTIDSLFHSEHALRIVLEDGAKLVGITAWAMFFVTASWNTLVSGRADSQLAK